MILRSLWLRPMLASPLRSLATIGGVAIGVAAVISTLLASGAAVTSLSADVEAVAGEERLEIRRPGGVDLADLERLRPLCAEAVLAPVIEGSARLPRLGELVRVVGIDLLLGEELDGPELNPGSGTLESARETMLQGDGAAMTRALADELGLAPGDRFELYVRSRRVELELAATFDPPRLATAWDRVLLADVALAQEVLGRIGRVDRIELRPRGGASLAGLAPRIAESLPQGYRVAPPSERRAEGTRMVRALKFNLTALAGVSLLVGIVLVGTTLATSVVQRRSAIALLRSLGASRAQLARGVLIEAGVIGLLGGALGVYGGWLGAKASLASVRSTVATIVSDALAGSVRLEPRWIALGLSLGLFSSLLAALLPLREALGTPPIQGLRAEHPESVAQRSLRGRWIALVLLLAGAVLFARLPAPEGRPIWALVSALFLLSSLLVLAAPLIDLLSALHLRLGLRQLTTSLRVAQAALEAGRRRAAWAAGAVGVAVALAVSMATMVGSFRQTVVDWTEQTMRSDLFVRAVPIDSGVPAGGLDPAVERAARELFGDEAVDPFHTSTAYVDGGRVQLAGAEFSVVAREGGVPFLDGRPSTEVFARALAEGGVVVNEPFLRRFGLDRGDTVELATPAGPLRREIAGVYRDYSGHTGRAVMDLADFLAIYPDEGASSIAIFLPPSRELEGARRELAALLGGEFAVEILNNREMRREVLEVFERTFAVTVALQLLASVVAAIAVITVLTALVHERRGDLATVRVLGGSRAQIAGVVLFESLLLGLAGALGGLVVGLAVGYVLVTVVNLQSFGWTLRFLPPWGSLLVTVGAVVPACLLAGLAPAWISLRSVPREALRELG